LIRRGEKNTQASRAVRSSSSRIWTLTFGLLKVFHHLRTSRGSRFCSSLKSFHKGHPSLSDPSARALATASLASSSSSAPPHVSISTFFPAILAVAILVFLLFLALAAFRYSAFVGMRVTDKARVASNSRFLFEGARRIRVASIDSCNRIVLLVPYSKRPFQSAIFPPSFRPSFQLTESYEAEAKSRSDRIE